MDGFNVDFDEEMQSGARLVVGKNAFTTENEPPPTRFQERTASIDAHVRRFVEFRDGRDMTPIKSAIDVLYDVARQGGNPYPPMIDALIADATVSEVWGTLRQAFGHSYDAFEVVESPFGISPA